MGFGDKILERVAEQLPLFVTLKVLAKLLGITPKRINNMVDEGKLKPEGHNKYNLQESVDKYIEFLKFQKKPKSSELDAAKLEKMQRENLVAADKLIDIDVAKQSFMGIASIITEQLESLAPRVAAELAPIDDIAILQDRLYEECRRIRETIQRNVENSKFSKNVS